MSERLREFLALVFVLLIPFFGLFYLFALVTVGKFLFGGSE